MNNTFENILKSKLEEKIIVNNVNIKNTNISTNKLSMNNNVYKKADDIALQLKISLARDKFLKEQLLDQLTHQNKIKK